MQHFTDSAHVPSAPGYHMLKEAAHSCRKVAICPFCRDYYMKGERRLHCEEDCPESSKCNFCEEYFRKGDEAKHFELLQVERGPLRLLRWERECKRCAECPYCHQYYHKNNRKEHFEECTESRLCEFGCGARYGLLERQQHLDGNSDGAQGVRGCRCAKLCKDCGQYYPASQNHKYVCPMRPEPSDGEGRPRDGQRRLRDRDGGRDRQAESRFRGGRDRPSLRDRQQQQGNPRFLSGALGPSGRR